jgi:hypothetical protein
MAIDRKKIINDMAKVKVDANEDGIISGFNVLVTKLPGVFWNSFAKNMVDAASGDIIEAVEELLVNAAHECGYHTGHGIVSSMEWDAVVKPMLETREDLLHAALAICTAWGWADAEAVELEPGKKMVVRAKDYYEADVAKDFAGNKAPRLMAYMFRGVCAAFMDLAYGGAYDPSGETGLYTFRCRQTKGIEVGDSHGEFEVVSADEYEG